MISGLSCNALGCYHTAVHESLPLWASGDSGHPLACGCMAPVSASVFTQLSWYVHSTLLCLISVLVMAGRAQPDNAGWFLHRRVLNSITSAKMLCPRKVIWGGGPEIGSSSLRGPVTHPTTLPLSNPPWSCWGTRISCPLKVLTGPRIKLSQDRRTGEKSDLILYAQGMHINMEIPKTATMRYMCHGELKRRG